MNTDACKIFLLVTPYAGVWIEISIYHIIHNTCYVTPYAGVWIEIHRSNHRSDSI